MFQINKYKKESGECPFDEFIKELKTSGCTDDLEKIQDYVIKLEELGNDILGNSTWAKKLKNNICELRPKSNRILYYYCCSDGSFVLLHGFKKKTNKTPKEEIEKAIRESLEYERIIKNGKRI